MFTLEPVRPAPDPAPASGDFAALRFGILGPMPVTACSFPDRRGVFTETCSERDFAVLGIAGRFVQDNQSPIGRRRGCATCRPPSPRLPRPGGGEGR